MSLAPLSSPSVPSNVGPSSELRAATLAKDQQKMEGAAAMALLETAGQTAGPKPMGNAGHHINVSV
jgi:hypothetical protein